MTAARLGIPEHEFWRMTPREFSRRAGVYRDQMEARQKEEEARFFNTLNAFGVVMTGKKWKWQTPGAEREEPEDFEERERRAMQKHLAYIAKRRAEKGQA